MTRSKDESFRQNMTYITAFTKITERMVLCIYANIEYWYREGLHTADMMCRHKIENYLSLVAKFFGSWHTQRLEELQQGPKWK